MKALIQKKKAVIILLIIMILGATLRLFALGVVPISPDWDEVALGYNAYSISETGRDEFGKLFPVVLRSFDDYKPALYTYLIIPFYKLFGLNIFSVRLPSAIFGIITIFSVYLLSKQLFKRNEISLLIAFLLAISPWHIQFSRIGFEANIGLGLNIFAAVFFLGGLKKPWLLTASAISAGLSLYAYQSEKVFTPLFILGLMVIFIKPLLSLPKKYLAIAFFSGSIVILPMVVYISLDGQSLLRAKGTSIFNNKTVVLKKNAQRNIYNINSGNKLGKILDNRRIEYGKVILDGYLSHYNPNWLINGDIARHHAPDMGLIYLWELPFILIGFYALLFSKYARSIKLTILFWFLLAPIPASITTGVPHAVRTLNFLPTWQIFTALGMLRVYTFMQGINIHNRMKVVLTSGFLLIVVFNFIYFLDQYFIQQNYFHASEWQYGYEKMIGKIKEKSNRYEKIVISDKYPMDKSYMFLLFYLKYDPIRYQSFENKSGGFAIHQKFDKYEFRSIDPHEIGNKQNILYVGNPDEFPSSARIIYSVYYPDGNPAMVMVSK